MTGDGGVDLFLVLSGFLLGTMLTAELSAEGSIDAVRFYTRRWFRIDPGYATAMLIQCLAIEKERAPQACPELWWSNLLFLNNIYPKQNFAFGPACMVHTWSLAVEFQMYLLTPPMLLLAHRLSKGHRALLTPAYFLVLSAGWFACCTARVFGVLHRQESGAFYGQAEYTNTVQRMAPYLAGVMAAVAIRQHASEPYAFPGPRARCVLSLLAAAILLASALIGAEPMYFILGARDSAWLVGRPRLLTVIAVLGRPLVGLSAAFLLCVALTGHASRLGAFLGSPAWRPLAVLSYSMYLLQYVGGLPWDPLYEALLERHVDPASSPLWLGALVAHSKVFIVVACTMPLALLNYTFVERPVLIFGHSVAARLSAVCAPPRQATCTPGRGVLV